MVAGLVAWLRQSSSLHGFSPISSMICSPSQGRTCFTGNAIWEKKLLKDNDDSNNNNNNNNNKHC
jgi:hypothetical protein